MLDIQNEADEHTYLDDEDLLDVRLDVANETWVEEKCNEHPEIVVLNSDDFVEDVNLINTFYKKFKYYNVDDLTKEERDGIFYVEFRDKMEEVTNQYIEWWG